MAINLGSHPHWFGDVSEEPHVIRPFIARLWLHQIRTVDIGLRSHRIWFLVVVQNLRSAGEPAFGLWPDSNRAIPVGS